MRVKKSVPPKVVPPTPLDPVPVDDPVEVVEVGAT
jgi:hypothetical protein